MIATSVIEEIHQLLEEGRLSQRKIASRIGVSRGTVNAVALGRRDCGRVFRQPDETGFIPPTGLPVRCPGCGGRVQMPCLRCYIRGVQGTKKMEGSCPC